MNQDKAPQEECFDQITGLLKNTSASTPIVFNCQAGISRTTTAMVSHLEPNHLHQDKNIVILHIKLEQYILTFHVCSLLKNEVKSLGHIFLGIFTHIHKSCLY